jgi:hypothetical protein
MPRLEEIARILATAVSFSKFHSYPIEEYPPNHSPRTEPVGVNEIPDPSRKCKQRKVNQTLMPPCPVQQNPNNNYRNKDNKDCLILDQGLYAKIFNPITLPKPLQP